jgi:spermidine synthase
LNATDRDLPSRGLAALIAFVTGAAVLALEITGARLLIPWFGATILVWTNVIGVTLGALALGSLAGGRLAERAPRRSIVALVLGLTAAGAAAFPFLVPPLARFAVPAGLPFDAAYPLLDRGSLLVLLVALAPPLFFAGAVTPFLVRAAASNGRVAHASGLISGLATLGSLVGTWLPVHFLIPRLGSTRTCLAISAVLLLLAVATLRAPRARRAAAALAIVIAAILATRAAPAVPGRLGGATTLAEVESRYQYARVEQDGETIALRLNEGLDSYHSLTVGDRLLTGAYYDAYLLLPPLASRVGATFDVAILGHAAGTTARQLLALHRDDPALRVVGVEIDPEVAALGAAHFSLPADDPRLSVVVDQDARVFVAHALASFELIVVDCYSQQVYVPFQVCSREFFAAARERLEEGGILAANLGGFEWDEPPLRAIVDTAADVFGEIALSRIPGTRNFLLAARRGGDVPDAASVSPPVPELAAMVQGLAAPGATRFYRRDPDAKLLTDDDSAIEMLADTLLTSRARREFEAVR